MKSRVSSTVTKPKPAYTIEKWFNEAGRFDGWLVSDANGTMIDIWPTKKQAQDWVARASGQPMKNPRPRKYASASERQAAYRARAPEMCFRAEDKTVDTLDRIAADLDVSRADLLLSMTKFALTNHDWARFGLTHKPLPFGYGTQDETRKENPMKAKTTKRKPTPAQLAARERFAEAARSGAFKKAGAKKRTITRKANPFARRQPVLYEVSANGVVFGVYAAETAQAARDALAVDAGYESEAQMAETLGAPSELTAVRVAQDAPATRRGNPVKYRDIAKGVAPGRVQYAVHMPDRPSYHAIAYFTKKADAVDTAQELSDRTGKPVAVTRVQVQFGPM